MNLASRVEGATKHLGVSILISEYTRAHLGDQLETRRLCQVQVVGIQRPVALYELPVNPSQAWHAHKARYEAALARYEAGDLEETRALLEAMGAQVDRPTALLQKHATEASEGDQPIFVLGAK